MSKPRMIVDENVLTALGIDEAQFRAMPLMDFFRMAMDRGFDVAVSGTPTLDGLHGKLTVTMANPPKAATP